MTGGKDAMILNTRQAASTECPGQEGEYSTGGFLATCFYVRYYSCIKKKT